MLLCFQIIGHGCLQEHNTAEKIIESPTSIDRINARLSIYAVPPVDSGSKSLTVLVSRPDNSKDSVIQIRQTWFGAPLNMTTLNRPNRKFYSIGKILRGAILDSLLLIVDSNDEFVIRNEEELLGSDCKYVTVVSNNGSPMTYCSNDPDFLIALSALIE